MCHTTMMFILRETVRFLRHNFGAWAMACVTFGVALGVSGLFAMLAWQAHSAMAELRANLAIEAFFDPGISSSEAEQIAARTLDTIGGTRRVTFISKEEALRDYTKSSGEDVQQVLGMNPLPASVKLYLKNPDAKSARALQAELRTVPGIEEVRGNFPLLDVMEARSHSLDQIALLLSALLLLSAFFYALVAGRHSFELSRETLRTFDLLGATRIASILPIAIASGLAGLIGGALGWALARAVKPQALPFLDTSGAAPLTQHESLAWLGLLVVVGMIIGALGALVASSRRG